MTRSGAKILRLAETDNEQYKALKSVLLRRHLFIKFRTLENSLNGYWRLRDYSSFHSCEIFPKVPQFRRVERSEIFEDELELERVVSGPNQNALKRRAKFFYQVTTQLCAEFRSNVPQT